MAAPKKHARVTAIAPGPTPGTRFTEPYARLVARDTYFWLPAPKDADFSLYIRAYWPKPATIDGTWNPPPVEKQT